MTSYSLSEEAIELCMLFQLDVEGNFFDSNCVEMDVEAVEMN